MAAQTTWTNLALAGIRCNRYKGPNIAGIDSETGALTPLFHPRIDDWNSHFRSNGSEIAALSATGRVTVSVLMDGTFLVGDHADSSTTTFLENEFAFAGLWWIRLDIDRIVTVGRYGPLGEASSWAESPDLSKVDEVGFVDLMPEAATAPVDILMSPRLSCTERRLSGVEAK
jgi:hypothetical protein